MEFKKPKVYLVGFTTLDENGLYDYLKDTDNTAFRDSLMRACLQDNISVGEVLCSFYAKMCYRSLTPGHNFNVTSVREIRDNLEHTIGVGHGSVFEHCLLNFVVSNCSRVFTHELVRHRVGTAFSQESGRYCRLDNIGFVVPPELSGEDCQEIIGDIVGRIESAVVALEQAVGLRDAKTCAVLEKPINRTTGKAMTMAEKKRLTSAIRRIAPNGQTNEMGFSVNLRSLRFILQKRTAAEAEWEIRYVFNQVADLVSERWPLILHGATITDTGDGLKAYGNLII